MSKGQWMARHARPKVVRDLIAAVVSQGLPIASIQHNGEGEVIINIGKPIEIAPVATVPTAPEAA